MRVKKGWNQKRASRSIGQMANGVCATIWKLSANVLLNLENENFETESQTQRLDIMEEIICFLVHYCDRWCYPLANAAQREQFVGALVGDLARMSEDSRFDVQGGGNYRGAFVDRLNRRSSDYASYRFEGDEGASFAMRCRFGEHVQSAMGERDSRWIPDYIVGRESPEIEASLRRSLNGLVDFKLSASSCADLT